MSSQPSSFFYRPKTRDRSGYLCELLRFSVQKYMAEIFNCVEAIVLHDPSPEARRGAMNVLTQLVQGLGVNMFHEMHEWLNPLASLSRRVAESDTDHVVKYV